MPALLKMTRATIAVKVWFLCCSCLVVLSGMLSCGNALHGKEAALTAVDRFHQHFNDGTVDVLYSAADDEYRQAVSRERSAATLTAIRQRLGREVSSATPTTGMTTVNMATFVTVTEETTFESGTGTETFVFRVRAPTAFLVSYNVVSKQLASGGATSAKL